MQAAAGVDVEERFNKNLAAFATAQLAYNPTLRTVASDVVGGLRLRW